MENPKKNIRVERLDELQKETLLRDCADIDLNNPSDKYGRMLVHLFTGDYDELFLSQSLLGIEGNEREEIMDLSRKYLSLCF